MRDALRWLLMLLVFAGMAGLCVVWLDIGGLWGLIGAGAGFLIGVIGAFASTGERLGNGYVMALMGLTVGLLAGVIAHFAWPQVAPWLQNLKLS